MKQITEFFLDGESPTLNQYNENTISSMRTRKFYISIKASLKSHSRFYEKVRVHILCNKMSKHEDYRLRITA